METDDSHTWICDSLREARALFPINNGFAKISNFIDIGARKNLEVIALELPQDLVESRPLLRIRPQASMDEILHRRSACRRKSWQREIVRGSIQISRNSVAFPQTESILELSLCNILIRRKVEIFRGSIQISRDAGSILQTVTILELRFGKMLIRRKLKISRTSIQISRNSFTMEKTETAIQLSLSQSLIGCKFEIVRGSNPISSNTVAFQQTATILELSLVQTLIRCEFERLCGFNEAKNRCTEI
jgi:hypothetical protein